MDVTHFEFKGERWKRITHEPYEKLLVGVDPGFTVDPTAICVMHHRRAPLDDFIVRYDIRETEQKLLERYEFVHVERLPLNTEYPAVVAHIAELMQRAPLRQAKPDLVVDATGVGISVAQLLDQASLHPIKVTITSSTTEQVQVRYREWHVGKPCWSPASTADCTPGRSSSHRCCSKPRRCAKS